MTLRGFIVSNFRLWRTAECLRTIVIVIVSVVVVIIVGRYVSSRISRDKIRVSYIDREDAFVEVETAFKEAMLREWRSECNREGETRPGGNSKRHVCRFRSRSAHVSRLSLLVHYILLRCADDITTNWPPLRPLREFNASLASGDSRESLFLDKTVPVARRRAEEKEVEQWGE